MINKGTMSNIEQWTSKLSTTDSVEVANKQHRKKLKRKLERESETKGEKESRKKKKKEKEQTKTGEELATAQSKERKDKEKTYIKMHQSEDDISFKCNQGYEKKNVCLELSTLERPGDANSFRDSSLESRIREERRLKKKKKKTQKQMERNKPGQDLIMMNISDDNAFDGNAENKKKRKEKSSSGISEEIVLTKQKQISQTKECKETENCYQRHQGVDGCSCNQGTENISVCLEPSTLERPGDANSFRDSSLETRIREERRLKKKKKKKKKQNEKERNKRGQELTMMEATDVNNDHVLDGNEVNCSRAKMSKHTEKPKDNEKLREAIAHADMIHLTYGVSKKQLQELKEQGIKVKKGPWSSQEVRLLQSNMDRLLETYELPDPSRVIFCSRLDKEDCKFWRHFARKNDFYKQLGKGIQRSREAIYKYAQRIYDDSNYVGRYGEEEVEELRRLHGIHGRDWVTVGQLMGRSRMSVNRKYSKLPANKGKGGKWTDVEIRFLKEAVYVVTNTAEDQPSPFQGIYWPAVAKLVETRNAEQCREKWLDMLCWIEDDKKKQWTNQSELKLITRLYKSGVTQECDVDWMEMTSKFKSIFPPQWLRKKWFAIRKKAPNYHQLEFEDILDYLYHEYSKTLRSQLATETSISETS